MVDNRSVYLLGHKRFFDDQWDKTQPGNGSGDIPERYNAGIGYIVLHEQVAFLFLDYLPLGKRDGSAAKEVRSEIRSCKEIVDLPRVACLRIYSRLM